MARPVPIIGSMRAWNTSAGAHGANCALQEEVHKPPPDEQYMLAQVQEVRRQLQASHQREVQKKVNPLIALRKLPSFQPLWPLSLCLLCLHVSRVSFAMYFSPCLQLWADLNLLLA